MLDPALLRHHPDTLAERLQTTRGYHLDVSALKSLESQRKALGIKTQDLQAVRNATSKAIGRAKANGQAVDELMTTMHGLADTLKATQVELEIVQQKIDGLALEIPNLPAADVPIGQDESDNVEITRWGLPSAMDFAVKDHVELGLRHNGLDAAAAAQLSGARFTVLRGPIARLHRALAQFMLDLHCRRHGYLEVNVPVIVNGDSLYGTGQLPKFEDDMFLTELGGQRRYLISTAEIALTNLVRDSIVAADQLPLRMVAHSLCFRSEAGSSGRDTRGMIRQHQFEKVELVSICPPAVSVAEHEQMTGCAEAVLQQLGLAYRKVLLCSADMGFTATKTYDLEVWLPSQQTYREISSCSLCGDFQARRMQARWRNPQTAKPEWLHTLNGSGVAVGRALIAVMENYQQADGSIRVPDVLIPYLDGLTILN